MESTQGFHAIMNLLLIPMWMLSGALFPSSGAATWVWWIMQANPLTYNVAATRMTLYGFADEYMKDLPSIEFCLLISFLFAVGTFVVSVLAVRKRPQGLPILDQR
jgi:ABC-2 type transport system permease protein